jgi:ribosome-associated protein
MTYRTHAPTSVPDMTETDFLPPLPPSKTRLKQAAHDLQALGARLVDLPKDRLQGLGLPETLYDAVRECQSITRHEARRRQLQYIGRLMRDIDPAAIEAQFSIWDGTSAAEVALQHSIERWRDRLMDDATAASALTELAAAHPGCDVQQLRTLMRNARREFAQKRPPRSHRELFRALRAIIATPAASDLIEDE